MSCLRDDRVYPKNLEFIIQPVHEKCEGCDHVTKDNTCISYANPSFWWGERKAIEGKKFWCPRATHLEKVEPEIHKMLNPIKASKRMIRRSRK